jgi:hypothetical protein
VWLFWQKLMTLEHMSLTMTRPKKTIHFKTKMYGTKGPGTTINWAL